MNKTPMANRKSIVLAGNRNAGKSTLFNKLIGHERSIVSDVAGTTTDPVWKASEIIGFGPVKIIDTAGIDDIGVLGAQRVKKSQEELKEADLIIYLINILEIKDISETKNIIESFKKKYSDKQIIFAINKCDLKDKETLNRLKDSFEEVEFISDKSEASYERILSKIIEKLKNTEEEKNLLEGMLEAGDTALLVVPIDTEAPKGRLILPQVQLIRACLDNGIKIVVCRDEELEETISEIKKIDLVITDSKVFEKVGKIVPKDIKITSFSILFARQKGDIDEFLNGARKLNELKDGEKILIAESCTHTVSHEDIGQVVIPNLIKKKTGKKLEFVFSYGKTLPENLNDFALIIQCGGCMMSRNNMMNRVYKAREKNIPITNYGVVLAYLKGVFERAVY
ncbi:[FeFe] hydrogenase H-cluster maturation GTPase HydF [Peptostreptococcus russellii]|uniref:[FeFe] hydrogenase H-cluster maturation GTPase HydF n=1 Tax=Peptostreptococcus russellii TaxID=215200 RepID=UPI0016240A0A|nr:[FeFe] hydrogenase H-cluster maturation GTPase HydF [Peptostreptococcus russellii]MBC2578180.1 [FeFe] hydrogenase H-cluster maturation GTPase HydF [Peptostreptococcus russellii]